VMCDGGPENQGRPVPCASAPRVFLGPITPKYEGAFTTTLTLGQRLTLYGLVDFKRGHSVFDANLAILCVLRRACEPNFDASKDPVRAAGYANGILSSAAYEASFTKLRQLSATYQLPARWVQRLGGSNASITVSGRNLFTWTKYPGVDPELTDLVSTSIEGREHYNQSQYQMPQLTQLVTSLRFSF
jgi:hypothetical protein